jgi:predicted component of type VI protein secretion system
MPQLFVLSGADVGRSFEITPGAKLGRSPECDIVLRDPSVSRRHAHFEEVQGRWSLVDDGSRNGISVNGQRTARAELEGQQEFLIGELLVRLKLESPVPAAPQTASAPQTSPAPHEEEIVLEGSEDFVLGETVQREVPRQVVEAARPVAPRVVAAPSASAVAAAAARGPELGQKSGVLQYHKQTQRRGMLITELGQYPLWVRSLVYLVLIALFALLAYGSYRFTTSLREKATTGTADG